MHGINNRPRVHQHARVDAEIGGVRLERHTNGGRSEAKERKVRHFDTEPDAVEEQRLREREYFRQAPKRRV
jgi:hypothetical protein